MKDNILIIDDVTKITISEPVLWATQDKFHQKIIISVEGKEDTFIDLFSKLESNLINLK